MPNSLPAAFRDFPAADADQCVKCGLCLPHCPTYVLSRHEGDSPRGRIALMQGLAQGVLEPEGSALPHLDGCLVCRACETVCPARVPYGALIDAGRKGLWRSGHRPGALWRMLAFWRRTPTRLRWLVRLLRLSQATGIARLLAHLPLGSLARTAKFIKRTGSPPREQRHAPAADASGRVALFLGCVARSLDAPTLHATVRVLNAMNVVVEIPSAQGCCGAMDAHAGDAETVQRLARMNLAAFDDAYDAVISTASGCGVQLQDYRTLDAHATSFSSRVQDVMRFVAAHGDRLPALRHKPARVIVHSPCTLRHGMREGGAIDVLRRIEGLAVEPLRYAHCCGAAGSYLFEHAESADQLGTRLLDALGDDVPDIFVTSNIGCALHVRRLARVRDLDMQVLHPVELLAASLPDARAP